MGKKGRLTPDSWGRVMPVHNPLNEGGPWTYRGTEVVMVEFATDADAVLDILPSDLELQEPAAGFMVIETNHWTTLGRYSEVYVGFMCTWQGEPYAYVPGVYVTGEASQILGREVFGFGKKQADRIEVITHGDGSVEAAMDVKPGDGALRAYLKPAKNEPKEALAAVPLICLKVIPDAEGGAPSLAQLVSVTFAGEPVVGSDGTAEVYSGSGSMQFGAPSDVSFPITAMGGCLYSHFSTVLPFGKVLKTYSKDELGDQLVPIEA